MIVGILSDSHGDFAATRVAVQLLESLGAAALFHCGDVCSTRVLDELVGREAYFVWGNCDTPTPSAREYVRSVGLSWPTSPLRVEMEGTQIAMCHGHESHFESVAAEPGLDYMFFGHTHVFERTHRGGPTLINPGALYRARVKTVATLDLASDRCVFWNLDGQAVR